jgi:hypothetical protein
LYINTGELALIPHEAKYLSEWKKFNKWTPFLCSPLITPKFYIVLTFHTWMAGSRPNSPVAINSLLAELVIDIISLSCNK